MIMLESSEGGGRKLQKVGGETWFAPPLPSCDTVRLSVFK